MKIRSVLYIMLILSLSISLISCSEKGSDNKIKIKTADDKLLVQFYFKKKKTKIKFSANNNVQEIKSDIVKGTRKYRLLSGELIADVRYREKGFKVKGSKGQLLWKVKISKTKIKISDNEENKNPFVLKRKREDRITVTHNQKELGKIKFYSDKKKIKIKSATGETKYKINTGYLSAMYGVLLIDSIPDIDKYIIMAELFSWGV